MSDLPPNALRWIAASWSTGTDSCLRVQTVIRNILERFGILWKDWWMYFGGQYSRPQESDTERRMLIICFHACLTVVPVGFIVASKHPAAFAFRLPHFFCEASEKSQPDNHKCLDSQLLLLHWWGYLQPNLVELPLTLWWRWWSALHLIETVRVFWEETMCLLLSLYQKRRVPYTTRRFLKNVLIVKLSYHYHMKYTTVELLNFDR